MLLKCHEAACVFACILYITVILRLQSAIASESCTDFLLVGNYSCLCFTGMSVNYWTGAGQTGFFKRIFYFKLMGGQRSVIILALCGNHTTTLAKKCDGEKMKLCRKRNVRVMGKVSACFSIQFTTCHCNLEQNTTSLHEAYQNLPSPLLIA